MSSWLCRESARERHRDAEGGEGLGEHVGGRGAGEAGETVTEQCPESPIEVKTPEEVFIEQNFLGKIK